MNVARFSVLGHDAVNRNSPDDPGDDVSHDDAEQPAGKGDGHGFSQELREDVAAARAERFFHADFAGALSDGNQHYIHQANAADAERERSDQSEQHLQGHGNDLPVVEVLHSVPDKHGARVLAVEAVRRAQHATDAAFN